MDQWTLDKDHTSASPASAGEDYYARELVRPLLEVSGGAPQPVASSVMGARITLERDAQRPAWEVRVEGTLVGLVWRERGGFRAVREGSSAPLPSRFTSRETAARGLARQAGHTDLDPRIAETGTRGRPGRPSTG